MNLLKTSKKKAIFYNEEKISYEDLIKHSLYYASILKGNNERVAIISENRPEWFYAFYSVWYRGFIPVPVDFLSTEKEIAYIIRDCEPKYIFCSEDMEAKVRASVKASEKECKILIFKNLESSEYKKEQARDFNVENPDETAVIIYTSGTTGSPKGVELSYTNIHSNLTGVSDKVKIYCENQVLLVLLPLHHTFPLLGSMIFPLAVQGSTAIAPSMASEDLLATLKNNKVTMTIGVPRLYQTIHNNIMQKIRPNPVARILFLIASLIKSKSLSRKLFKKVHDKFGGALNFMICGGAEVNKKIIRDFVTLGFDILEGYGMTEAAPMITFTRPSRIRPGSPGEPLPGISVEIRDGEICAKGRNIMKGYYKNQEATAEVLKDGWLHTGDIGYMKNNFLYITGRKKEIIVLPNGKNINPSEIESDLLERSPFISDAGVFALNGLIHALIVPDFEAMSKEGIHSIDQTVQDAVNDLNIHISEYKKIKNFKILKQELPRTRLGKLKRFCFQDIYEKGVLTDNSEQVKEPDFKEYIIIKNFLMKLKKNTVVKSSSHIEIDLALDSLDKINFHFFLNSTFGVDLPEDFFIKTNSVIKIAEHIKKTRKKISYEEINWKKIIKVNTGIEIPKTWLTFSCFNRLMKFAFKLYFLIKGIGTSNIPQGPCIFVPNHQSFLDSLFVTSYLNKFQLSKTYFYAKEKHFKNKWKKFLAKRHNVIVMDLNKNLTLSIQKLASALKKGKNLVIFPEGTRSKDGTLGDFKKTFAILSRELNIPVVPVVIDGAFKAMPVKSIFPRPYKKITVEFLKPIYPDKYSEEGLVSAVYSSIKDKLTKTIKR